MKLTRTILSASLYLVAPASTFGHREFINASSHTIDTVGVKISNLRTSESPSYTPQPPLYLPPDKTPDKMSPRWGGGGMLVIMSATFGSMAAICVAVRLGFYARKKGVTKKIGERYRGVKSSLRMHPRKRLEPHSQAEDSAVEDDTYQEEKELQPLQWLSIVDHEILGSAAVRSGNCKKTSGDIGTATIQTKSKDSFSAPIESMELKINCWEMATQSCLGLVLQNVSCAGKIERTNARLQFSGLVSLALRSTIKPHWQLS
eukprot:scaffold4306_cov198-Chaetoceros_neogracile.AAC.2